MFTNPSPTAYDLRFEIAGFPVRVHPLFWVTTILFGFDARAPWLTAAWVLCVFGSILLHELGHGAAFRYFGLSSEIVLYGFGGLAIPSRSYRRSLSSSQQIFVALAGPFAGFLLAALVLLVVQLLGGAVGWQLIGGFLPAPTAVFSGDRSWLNPLLSMLLWVNMAWGLINLLPVYPLDGGIVSRYAFLLSDRRDSIRLSLWLSVIVGGLVAIWALVVLQSVYLGALFAILAYQSYRMLNG